MKAHGFRGDVQVSIFQPPTDNLYKFMAISGLVILGFFLIWPEMEMSEFGKRNSAVNGRIANTGSRNL